MLKGQTSNILKATLFAILGIILSSGFLYSQVSTVLIDTSEYLPHPDGVSTNLAIAASKGYVYEIHRLKKLGAKVNFVDEVGATPLIYAVANNQKSCVIALLTYAPHINNYTNLGETALHIAARSDYLEIAELLIRDSANINIRDKYGCSPLHYSSIYGYHYMTDLLLYYEADVNIQSNDGTTPLMAAIWSGYAGIADLLISYGANVNIKDKKGLTALHIAAQNGDTLISRLLLDKGANIASITNAGHDIGTIASRIGSKEYSEFVISNTDWMEKRNPDMKDPLEVARKHGRIDSYKIFKEHSTSSTPKISFEQVQIALNTKINYDIYVGGRISFIEPLYKIRLNLGFEFKPWYSRVLQKEDENEYYQYFDKRYLLTAGTGKEFHLSENLFSGSTSIIVNLNMGYLVANQYPGTYSRPDNRFVFIPSLGLERNVKYFSFSCLYEFMNTGLYKAGPHWLKVAVAYNIHFSGHDESLKKIKWY